MNRRTANTEFLCPIHERHGAPIVRQNSCGSLVSSLLFHRCPTAIARFVVAVVVLAFNSHPSWTLTHVGKEVSEVSPSLADGDSPAAVMFERFAVWIAAPLNHRVPGHVHAGLRHPVLLAVAATTLDCPKVLLVHSVEVSTVAQEFAKTTREWTNACEIPCFLSNDGLVARFPHSSRPFSFLTSAALSPTFLFEDVSGFECDLVSAITSANPQVTELAFAGVLGDYQTTAANAATVDKSWVFWHGVHAWILQMQLNWSSN